MLLPNFESHLTQRSRFTDADFAPFDIDVTTIPVNTKTYDPAKYTRVAIGGNAQRWATSAAAAPTLAAATAAVT
jgi:hypothetical protein